jgi:hypothetical protein
LSSDASSPDSDLAHDVRCLKHEVRQLKSLRRSPARLFASASALPMETVDCAPSVCGFGRRERTLFAKLEEDIAALMSATSQHDFGCLKHEVRLLKARTSQSETPEDMHPASCGELHRLEEKVDALCAVIGQVTSEDVRHNVKCMKFELKRLLGIRERGMSGSPGVDHFITFLVDAVKKEVTEELIGIRSELHGFAAGRDQSQECRLEPAVRSSDLNALRREVEQLRGEMSGSRPPN